MKRILILLLLTAFPYFFVFSFSQSLTSQPSERLVGGDLSLVPAYESAGDQWLDEKGKAIADLISYVHDKGWNAVRVRLFVNPDKSADPAVCQDYAYALALSQRVKEAGMKLLLDFHYSDTWADPSTQRIPASWSDHSDGALARQLYDYTLSVVSGFIAEGAQPDYVQVGNEITYGLLWKTTDGHFPASSSQYAAAGYCPTWSTTYAQGATQWRRTASLLNNAAHAVRQGFHNAGIDSMQVKIVLHTEMGYAQRNSDNFYRHVSTAGFKDFDVIGLSYYPFWHGPLSTLATLLTTLAADFPDKPVQIVETAWYNNWYPSSADYTIAQLNSRWTANGTGMVNFLNDLVDFLKDRDQVDGLYYWTPEECGNGYWKKVMNDWINRGMWQNGSSRQHPILKNASGETAVAALAKFRGEAVNGIVEITTEEAAKRSEGSIYDLSGRKIVKRKFSNGRLGNGPYIRNGKKVMRE